MVRSQVVIGPQVVIHPDILSHCGGPAPSIILKAPTPILPTGFFSVLVCIIMVQCVQCGVQCGGQCGVQWGNLSTLWYGLLC
jgi:hypothetical protein